LFPFTATVVDSGNPTRTATRAFTLAIGPRQAFAVQPTNTPYMDPIAPNVVVQLTDGNNAPVPGAVVTLGFGTNPTGATLLGGTTAVTNASGLATFANVRPSLAGTYTLVTTAFTVPGPASTSFTVTPLTGAIADPAGDNANIDILTASATTDGKDLTFEVRYGTGFTPATSMAFISLDTDQNNATGHPGIASSGTVDVEALGGDYLIRIDANFDGNTPNTASLFQYAGTVNNFNFLGTVPLTILADGYRATAPLSMLGNDDGLLNFKVVSSQATSPNTSSGIEDVAPNTGAGPGTITPAGIVEHMSVNQVTTTFWFLGGPNSQRVAQVITPDIAGVISEIRVWVDVCNISLEIRGVSNGTPNATVLGSQSFSFGQIQTASAPFKKLVLTNPVAVSAGTPVALVFDAPVSCGISQGPDADFYPGGASFFSLGGGAWNSFGTQNDIPFQVKIKP